MSDADATVRRGASILLTTLSITACGHAGTLMRGGALGEQAFTGHEDWTRVEFVPSPDTAAWLRTARGGETVRPDETGGQRTEPASRRSNITCSRAAAT